METKNFGKNLLLYEDWYKNRRGDMEAEGFGLFIKVTDYRKGYWAETPLEGSKIEALVNYLKDYLEKQPRLEVEPVE